MLGGLKPIIISNRNLIAAIAQIFGEEYHSYCLHHLTENFLKEATKYDILKEATKQIVEEIFHKVVYALTIAKYTSALQEWRYYKVELVALVEDI